jgi:glycosyltransferase involved in cell wall biosynthesis
MRVSVIIPFYKAQDTIKNCIRSIQAQDYKDVEIIVVEDGKQEIDREAGERLTKAA